MREEVYLIYTALINVEWMVNPRQEYKFERKPPLGLMYLSASLSRHGIESKIFDQSVDGFTFGEIAERIKEEKPLFVGIYSDSTLKPRVLSFIRAIKEVDSNIKVVIGGPACVEYDDFHKDYADIVCQGEGEITVCEIADHFLGRKRIEDIKGITFLKDGRINKNKERELIEI